MKKLALFLLLPIFMFFVSCSNDNSVESTNDSLIKSSNSGTSKIILIDSLIIMNSEGDEYLVLFKNNTIIINNVIKCNKQIITDLGIDIAPQSPKRSIIANQGVVLLDGVWANPNKDCVLISNGETYYPRPLTFNDFKKIKELKNN